MSLNLVITNPNTMLPVKSKPKGDNTLRAVKATLHRQHEHRTQAAAAARAASSAAAAELTDGEIEAPARKKQRRSSIQAAARKKVAVESDELQESEADDLAAIKQSADERHLAKSLQELKVVGRHFSKIANRFVFEDHAAAYQVWAIQFKAELLNNDLDSILTSDPSAIEAEDQMIDPKLYFQQQKAVFHMIFQCMPKDKLSVLVTLPTTQQTGFAAWQALRQFYIGDEQAYLASLESKFQRARWEQAEAFPAFETRFDSLCNELQNAGAAKLEHVKKSALMSAVEDSHHKDAQGNSVFVRLNTVSKIHFEKPYREWITALRIEAQQIQDSLHKKGTKRSHDREERGKDTAAMEVSFVAAPSGPSSRPLDAGRQVSLRGGAGAGKPGEHIKPLCRNMQFTGRCTFGARCKFSHNIPANLLGQNTASGGASGGSLGDFSRTTAANARGPCFDFQKGKCNRGANCRFAHSSTAPPTAAMAQQFELLQMDDSSPNRA